MPSHRFSGCVDRSITLDQPKSDYACTATSRGGTTGPVTVGVGRDATAPAITADVAPSSPDGDEGCYVSPVSVRHFCSDATSGVAISPPDHTIGEGAASQIEASGSDRAGNTTSIFSGPIDVDLTDPQLACEASPTTASPASSRLSTKTPSTSPRQPALSRSSGA